MERVSLRMRLTGGLCRLATSVSLTNDCDPGCADPSERIATPPESNVGQSAFGSYDEFGESHRKDILGGKRAVRIPL